MLTAYIGIYNNRGFPFTVDEFVKFDEKLWKISLIPTYMYDYFW